MEFDREKASVEMTRRGKKKTWLAGELGVSRQTLHKYLRGALTPPAQTRRRMEALLDLGEGELDIRGAEPPESAEIDYDVMLEVMRLTEQEIARRDLSPTPEQRTAIYLAAYRHATAVHRVDMRMVELLLSGVT